MQSRPIKLTFKLKKEENGALRVNRGENDLHGSTITNNLDRTLQQSIDVTSEEGEDPGTEDEDNQSCENSQNQLVVYDPAATGTGKIEAVPDHIGYQPAAFPRYSLPNQSSRVLPSVGAFTVQCANCFKWRLIPTKEKYEEIREHILEQPFFCETAREWRPEISCEDPADISQDGSRLWAIDKPNIAQPPSGWQRLLRIRGEGSTKFADVYYVAPSGKRLRSMVEIQRYLLEHPEYLAEGVTMSQFSFQIPRPLQENYVRKRPAAPARLTTPCDGNNSGMQGLLEPSDVNPIAWVAPDESTDLQLSGPGRSTSYFEAPVFEPVNRPAKQARTPSKHMCSNNSVYNQHKVKVEEPQQARNGAL